MNSPTDGDHFSRQANAYARFRPRYPPSLFRVLASLVAPPRRRAWDCGTGSGQAAVGLAPHFSLVVGTDLSRRQLANAVAHPGVRYVVAEAGAEPFADRSVDLLCAAQSLHWFATDRFYEGVRRVVRPGGIIAAWCYGLLTVEPGVDALVRQLYSAVHADWPAERVHVEQGYETLPFPWDAIGVPAFTLHAEWSVSDLLGYLATWSAVQRFRDRQGRDPVGDIEPPLREQWGAPERARIVHWPLHLRVGRIG